MAFNPPSEDFKQAVRASLEDILPQKTLDEVWKKIRITTVFESLDGYTLAGNSPTLDGTGIALATAASLNSTSQAYKTPISTFILKAAPKARMRVSVDYNTGSLTSSISHLVVGTYGSGSNYFGFETSGTTLSGSSGSSAGTQSTVSLETISEGTYYNLEARLDKLNNKIVFLVDGVEKGTITTNVPDTSNIFSRFMDFYIKTTNTSAKSMAVSFFDYVQEYKI